MEGNPKPTLTCHHPAFRLLVHLRPYWRPKNVVPSYQVRRLLFESISKEPAKREPRVGLASMGAGGDSPSPTTSPATFGERQRRAHRRESSEGNSEGAGRSFPSNTLGVQASRACRGGRAQFLGPANEPAGGDGQGARGRDLGIGHPQRAVYVKLPISCSLAGDGRIGRSRSGGRVLADHAGLVGEVVVSPRIAADGRGGERVRIDVAHGVCVAG